MSHRRRNEQILLQLGDPLPLPYLSTSGSKSSSSSSNVRDSLTSDALYKRNINARLKEAEAEVAAESLHKPIPKLIHLNNTRPTPIRRDLVKRQLDIELILEIESKLKEMKELAEMDRLTKSELEFLKDVKFHLDREIHTHEDTISLENEAELAHDDNNILKELERIQNEYRTNLDEFTANNSANSTSGTILSDDSIDVPQKKTKDNHYVLIIILCTIVVLLLPSFISKNEYGYIYHE